MKGMLTLLVFIEATFALTCKSPGKCEEGLPLNFLQCNVRGRCQGLAIDAVDVSTANQCLLVCKETDQCQWYSFDKVSLQCMLLKTCDTLDEEDTNFTSGEKECAPLQTSYSKVLIATGNPMDASVLTEVIDLADESASCEALADHPIQVEGASGGLINGSQPLICGGWIGNYYTSECYMAGGPTSDPVARLLTPRRYSAAVAINSHQLWVTGGIYGSNILASTEIVDILANPPTIVPGPELPVPMDGHCIVQFNQSTVLFMGGYPNYKKTFFFDTSTQTWTNGPDMNHQRMYFGCGLTIMGSDLLAVVSGGIDSPTTAELLNVGDPNGLKWSAGPDLPKRLHNHQMVSVDGKVVAIGGYSNDGYFSKSLYKLECAGECQWMELSQKLTVARRNFVAMTIPDEMTNCKKANKLAL